jgi:predicted HD superfamily hydrolase involved in NAD metabolism
LARRVRERLGQRHRSAHVLRVARLATRLARAHGVDPDRARLAAMLHDLARLWADDRLLDDAARRGIVIGPFERANPIVLHAPLGAALACEEFGVSDEGVLSAIRKHTVADAVMEPLDAVVYLADGLEPGRDFPERAALTELALADLDAALAAVIASSVRYLESRGLTVAPQTLALVGAPKE